MLASDLTRRRRARAIFADIAVREQESQQENKIPRNLFGTLPTGAEYREFKSLAIQGQIFTTQGELNDILGIPTIVIPTVNVTLPSVVTNSATQIVRGATTVTGTIGSTGNSTSLTRGVCWSESELPTIDLPTKLEETGLYEPGLFTFHLTGLTSESIYLRMYAHNESGTTYGALILVTTVRSKWSNWIDGASAEHGYGIATDPSGNVYVTGYSDSSSFVLPGSGGTTATKPSYFNGAFVIKYNTNGVAEWGNWIDGASSDLGYGIATDASGNAYVTGYSTSSSFTLPGPDGTAKPSSSNGAFVVKYNTNGVAEWGRWIDGANSEYGYGIATDVFGNVYVTGYSTSSSFILPGPNGTAKPSSSNGAFVVKYNTNGVAEWGNWIDGASFDIGYGIATDASGNVYVTGHSISGSLVLPDGTAKPSSSNGAFVVKYNTNGVAEWGTWIDEASSEYGYGIATDASGNVYVIGSSTSSSFVLPGANGTAKPSTSDGAFVVKYNTNGVAEWGNWIDGTSSEQGYGIATDASGNIYITGYSDSSSLVLPNGTAKPSTSGGAFIVKYDTHGDAKWSTWIDGPSIEEGRGIATDPSGNVYVTGYSSSNFFALPGTTAAKPSTSNGAFVVKYNSMGQFINSTTTTGSIQLTSIANISNNSCPVSFEITSLGGSENIFIKYGVCWDTQPNPTVSSSLYEYSGIFQNGFTRSINVSGLTAPTYYIRPFIQNISGIAYGTQYIVMQMALWGNWIDGASSEYGYGIATDASGNVYITGSSTSASFVLPGANGTTKPSTSDGTFVVKYNTNGIALWGNWFDGFNSDYGRGIATDASGNVYVTGYSTSSSLKLSDNITLAKPSISSNFGAFVVKYNTNGVAEWGNWIDGASSEYGYTIASDSSGNVYVTGPSTSSSFTLPGTTVAKSSTNSGTFIVKYNTIGVAEWGRWIDGANYEQGYGITTDSSGNVYVIGYSNTPDFILPGLNSTKKLSANSGAFIVKYNMNGDAQWGNWIDGASSEEGYGIATDASGNVYVTGYSNSSFTLPGSNGSAGTKYSSTNSGAFVVKYNTNGEPQWGNWIDGDNIEYGYGIATDVSGNVYVTGLSYSDSFKLPNGTTKPSTSSGAFVVKYNTNGDVKWSTWIDGLGIEEGRGIAADASGNVYVTGSSSSSSFILPGTTVAKPSTLNGAFVIKYNTSNPIFYSDE